MQTIKGKINYTDTKGGITLYGIVDITINCYDKDIQMSHLALN